MPSDYRKEGIAREASYSINEGNDRWEILTSSIERPKSSRSTPLLLSKTDSATFSCSKGSIAVYLLPKSLQLRHDGHFTIDLFPSLEEGIIMKRFLQEINKTHLLLNASN